MANYKFEDGKQYKEVFAKSIRKNGKIIYPSGAKVFHFWVQA